MNPILIKKYIKCLSGIIAEASIWAPVQCVSDLQKIGGCWYPNVRRKKRSDSVEKKENIDVKLDNNTYANHAIKNACGFCKGELKGYSVCHIWPMTTYDTRYHTCISNLVLLPSELASLSDGSWEISACLRYRSFELYNWHPKEMEDPKKPNHYPHWPEPRTYSENIKAKVQKLLKKL
jgi:hypothetical protein